eukprot:scaffold10069_cov69-Cylindrotheca_fusiformis.AAC.4
MTSDHQLTRNVNWSRFEHFPHEGTDTTKIVFERLHTKCWSLTLDVPHNLKNNGTSALKPNWRSSSSKGLHSSSPPSWDVTAVTGQIMLLKLSPQTQRRSQKEGSRPW